MAVLVDTSVLGRLANSADAAHDVAQATRLVALCHVLSFNVGYFLPLPRVVVIDPASV